MAAKLYVPSCDAVWWHDPDSSSGWETGAEARLTLVSAPAGFGKTTVLAAWLFEASAEGRCVVGMPTGSMITRMHI